MSALRKPSRRAWNPVRVGIRDGRITKLKRCPDCGQEKECRDDVDSEFGIHARRENGSVQTWTPLCKACTRRAQKSYREARAEQINETRRQRHAERMATDPEYREAKRQRNYDSMQRWLADPENAEKARVASVRYHRERRRRDKAAVNEEARMLYALRADRDGRAVNHRATVIDGTRPRIPAEPFREWLVAYQRLADLPSDAALARELGMTERRLRSVLAREYRNVSLDIVDKAILTGPLTVELDGRPIVRLDGLYRNSPDALL